MTRREFTPGNTPADLVDVLRQRAESQPDSTAFVYLTDGEDAGVRLTFAELDAQARAIAARLQGLGGGGEAAILLYAPGLEFMSAFFGCLYAGTMAVPLPVPRMKASLTQFLGIVGDVRPRVVLSTDTALARLRRMNIPELEALICLTTEDTQPELARAWSRPAIVPDEIAYLQYTSGSTANRKGVSITHANVIANLLGLAERFRHHEKSVCVNWLPHTHDLGLVAGILQPLYHGHSAILMSPTAFVQQPVRWLNAISKYRGTYASSPNFGYDLCITRTTSEQRAALDLSSWDVALNGAEPVRARTLEEFIELFAPCGFRREALFPGYGLAEATLGVSIGPGRPAPIIVNFEIAAAERGRAVESTAATGTRPGVACGQVLRDTHVAIVNPETREPSAAGEIGEIWVHGPGVARGYWNKPDDTEYSFNARIAGGDERRYLRTGDLGLIRDGQVFVSGRLKDLIIVRGANHYPQDIEWTVERSHAAFRPGCSAAFSIDEEGTEQVVVVAELEREYLRGVDSEELVRTATRAVAEEHELHLRHLVLLKTGTVPRTTSGKIQRSKCRAQFLTGQLAIVLGTPGADVRPAATPPPAPAMDVAPRAHEEPSAGGDAASDVIAWLRDYAGERLNSRVMDERRSLAPHVVLDLGNHGVLGLQVPREYGGLGLGYVDSLRVIEQIGAIDQTLAAMTIVHNSLGIAPILGHGPAALKADLLPRLASGRELVAFAITEPFAGSNPQAIRSTAVPDGRDTWRLRGQKSWSGTAGWSSVINVIAQNIDESGQPNGLSAFAVPRGSKGLRIGPEALTLGMRAMVQNTVYLDDVRVTAAQCLGAIGGGMAVAQDAMMQGRLAIGATCVGGIKRSLQLLLRYAERRSISTGRLVDNPVLLERAAALTGAVTAIEALVGHAARRLDQGLHVPGDVLIVCKTAGSEWLWQAADDLVQFLGGRGYIETNVAAQLLRDARATRILEGPTEALTMFLGSRAVNDSGPLHRFLADDLGASAVSARLADVVGELGALAAAHVDAGSGVDARRHVYALAGQVTTDALLLAALPADAAAANRGWAEQRFTASSADALARAKEGVRLTAASFAAAVGSFTASIGDVEQTLPGEDHELDEMLLRAGREQTFAPAPSPVAPVPPPQETAPAQPVQATVDARAIEQFIVRHIARALKLPESAIDPERSVFDYGVDSVTAVMLAVSLEDWLGTDCNPELVYDVPVIRRFAERLAGRRSEVTSGTASGGTIEGAPTSA